jgi:hypothetical protein
MSMPEATATAIAQPQMTPMMTVVPDGVAPGGQFMVQTMSGCVMVACPDTSKPGDQIQIMVPATMAAPQPTAVQTPTFPSHPSAYAVDGSRPNLQNGIVSLPQPVYRSSDGGNKLASPDALASSYATGSPDDTRQFFAPNTKGLMTESDFANAMSISGIGNEDPFAAFLTGTKELELNVDAEGRAQEIINFRRNTCMCYIACL